MTKRPLKLKIVIRKSAYAVLCRGLVVFKHRDMNAVRTFIAAFNEADEESRAA